MAGRIPDRFIDELIARADIVDVVGERLQMKKTGSNYQALCPFHNEKTPSFTVSPSKQFYHCFGCGAHGTAIRFLMEYDRMEFREAVEQLARQVGLEVPEAARGERQAGHPDLYGLLEQAAAQYRRWLREHPDHERAVSYLKQRGLTGEVARQFEIGFAPPGWDSLGKALGAARRAALITAGLLVEKEGGRSYDRFRDRIMFPIRDRRGRVIGFGGRVLGDGEPKYLNSPETPVFQKGQELYGLYELLQADRHPADILVVEGYMDVVALAQHGMARAVATLGTATSTRQVERLFRVTRDLVFCSDGAEAGRPAAWRALESALPAMREGRQVRFLFLPEGEDPDSLVRARGRSGFEVLLRAARPLSEQLFDRLTAGVDLDSMDGRARLVEAALPAMRRLPPDVYRHMLLEKLAALARLELDYLEAVVDGRRERPQAQAEPHAAAGRQVRRTPVRLAVALLLQRPGLAAAVEDLQGLEALDVPGIGPLAALLEVARREPHITTSALLERFRGSEHEGPLWKLAVWEHMVPEAGLDKEFRDALSHVVALGHEQRFERLNERLQRGELTPEEWAEWGRLKKQR